MDIFKAFRCWIHSITSKFGTGSEWFALHFPNSYHLFFFFCLQSYPELSRDGLSFSDVSITKITFFSSDIIVKDFLLVSFFWAYWFYFGKRTGETRPVLGWSCRKTWVLSPWRFDESEEGSCWLLCPFLLNATVQRESGSRRQTEHFVCPLQPAGVSCSISAPVLSHGMFPVQQHVWKSIQGWVMLIRVSTSLDIIQGRKALECSRFPSSCLVDACNGLHPFFGYCPL